MNDSVEKDIRYLRICDYVQVNIGDEPTWLIVIDFVGKNELIGIPLYEETLHSACCQPRVRVFKNAVISCRKHREWDELEITPWLARHRTF